MTDYDELLAIYDEENACGRTNGLEDELAVALRAALAAQPEPLFDAVVKTTMPGSLHMDGTSPVMLAAWADTETLRQVKGQRIVVYPAAAGSATPEEDPVMGEELEGYLRIELARLYAQRAELRTEVEELRTALAAQPEVVRVGSAALIVDRDRILLGRRAKEPNYGKWVMPGGKIEPGETIAQAAVREVREETGLEVEITARFGIFEIVHPSEHSVFVLSEARVVGGVLTGASDLSDVAWFDRGELDDVDLSDPVRAALRAALAAQPEPGPWPKFCPWCMGEFNADGTFTPAAVGSVTPERLEDPAGPDVVDPGEHRDCDR